MQYNMYSELVDKIEDLINKNKELKKLYNTIPTDMLIKLCNAKLTGKSCIIWRELYKERRVMTYGIMDKKSK